MAADASAQLHAVAARLRETADGRQVMNAMRRGIRAEVAPLITSARGAARRQLPHSGGLAEHVASQRITVSVLTGARTAGVRLYTTAPATEQTNDGYVRHPTFGRRGNGEWHTEQIPEARDWWTGTMVYQSPAATPLIVAELEAVAARIQAV